MSRAVTIDRLEYTRRRFAKQLGLEEPPQKPQKTVKEALCVYSCSLLNRSIHILSYSINLIERLNSQYEVYRREGTE